VVVMLRIHHVNLGILPGGEDAEAEFLSCVGYRRVPSPPEIPMAKWFEAPDGSQIHLTEDTDHRPPAMAHVAVVLGEAFDDVVERLKAQGVESTFSGLQDLRVAMCADPAGNRWELRTG
jgi:hypothetical protein